MSGIIYLVLRIALAAALYGFLVWAMVVLWRELTGYARSVEKTNIPTLTLAPSGISQIKPLHYNVAEVTIGRDPSCNCYLEEKTISGKHARLSYRMEQWWVEDLKSTNGTFLNDEPVSEGVVLTSGDMLRVGQLTFLITINAPRPVDTESGVL